jgi:hypothetical protein
MVFFPSLPVPPHVHIDFVVPPPGCGRSVTDFWGWGAHRVQSRCPDDVSDDMCERGVPGGTLNLNSTDYPDHGRYGDLLLQWKISMADPGIEPGTSWLVVRSSDHQATRLVTSWTVNALIHVVFIYKRFFFFNPITGIDRPLRFQEVEALRF